MQSRRGIAPDDAEMDETDHPKGGMVVMEQRREEGGEENNLVVR